jgi:hypothetical protein
MGMFYLVFFIAFLVSLSINLYHWINKPDISTENAKKQLKKYIVRMMLFYHQNYPGVDQIAFIEKWIGNIRNKLNDVPKERIELFKEKINAL